MPEKLTTTYEKMLSASIFGSLLTKKNSNQVHGSTMVDVEFAETQNLNMDNVVEDIRTRLDEAGLQYRVSVELIDEVQYDRKWYRIAWIESSD